MGSHTSALGDAPRAVVHRDLTGQRLPSSITNRTLVPQFVQERLGLKPATPRELESRFLAALPEIEHAAVAVARRNRLSASERDDFASEVKLAFIEQGYRVFARFEGRSSLRTYLTVVVQRLFLDYRRRLWGKWHASAQALRLGPAAQQLEVLIHRDGHSVSEACAILQSRLGASETGDQLAELAAKLPARLTVRTQSTSDPEAETAQGLQCIARSNTFGPHEALEQREIADACQAALSRTLNALEPDDCIVLRLRFEDGVSVADIARGLKLDQKRLYRRIEELLGELRRAMEAAGLRWEDVCPLIERGQCHLRLPPTHSGPAGENPPARPSKVEAAS